MMEFPDYTHIKLLYCQKVRFSFWNFHKICLYIINYQSITWYKTLIGRFIDKNELIVRGLGLFDSPLLAPRPLSLSPRYFALLIYKWSSAFCLWSLLKISEICQEPNSHSLVSSGKNLSFQCLCYCGDKWKL